MKKALITGITGQDGSYLTELLLDKGYEVHGLVRRSSRGNDACVNIEHLRRNKNIYYKKLFLHHGDLEDTASVFRVIKDIVPDEIYNLGAQADVGESFAQPLYTTHVNGDGAINILEAMRHYAPKARMYQASTSELFGKVKEEIQDEESHMSPQSPYAIGKYVAYQFVKNYREGYGLHVSNGLTFNHASPRRTDDYVDRKVTRAVARIKLGKQDKLYLGNLSAKRDWGYAKEYVEAFWLMLQQDKADDYVIGTGETHSVQEWVDTAFEYAGLKSSDHVVISKNLLRPNDVELLHADFTKMKTKLGWEPKTKFKDLIRIMVDADIKKESQYV